MFNLTRLQPAQRHVRLLAALLTLMTLGLTPAPVANAAVINVTSKADELNSDGDCSLREAIRSANLDVKVDACMKGSGADTIVLPAGVYNLTVGGIGENDGAKGDLDLTGVLNIAGASGGQTIIDGNAKDRVFDVRSNSSVTLIRLRIRNGRADLGQGGGVRSLHNLTLRSVCVCDNQAGFGGGIYNLGKLTITEGSSIFENRASEGSGGGIWNDAAGTVTLSKSEVSGNYADTEGGGIWNKGSLTLDDATINGNFGDRSGGGIHNLGSLTIRNGSEIFGNSSEGEDDASGGGVYTSGSLTMNDSSVHGNVGDIGGGLYNHGTATIDNSEFRNNQYQNGSGGGIYNDASLLLTNSDVSFNTSDPASRGANGGGIDNRSQLTLTNTSVTHNTTHNHGGGIFNTGTLKLTLSSVSDNLAYNDPGNSDGGGIYNAGTASLSRTTVSSNEASNGDGGGGDGGGLFNAGTLTVTTSTIDGNYASNGESEDFSEGGGIHNAGLLLLINSTVSGNEVLYGYGGGIANEGSGSGAIRNATISGNIAEFGGHSVSNDGGSLTVRNTILGEDCLGTLASRGHNLIQVVRRCTIVDDTTGNQLGVDAKLGPLQNNGGPTRTQALLPGSPAIDRGNPSTPGSGGSSCPSTDQRGVQRPQDGNNDGAARCDIGAYEVQSAAATGQAIPPEGPADEVSDLE